MQVLMVRMPLRAGAGDREGAEKGSEWRKGGQSGKWGAGSHEAFPPRGDHLQQVSIMPS